MDRFVISFLVLFCYTMRSLRAEYQYTCKMVNGKGTGEKMFKVKGLSGIACVSECIRLKKEEHKGINGVTEYKTKKRSGCWCVYHLHENDNEQKRFKSCHLKRVSTANLPLPPVIDMSYNNFKDKGCTALQMATLFKGCYKKKANNRGRLLLTYRYDIEWETKRQSAFGHSFVCACAMAARAKRVQTFATHFWGECWEMLPEELGEKGYGCELGDGMYSEECSEGYTKSECIGTTDFAVYTYTFFAITDNLSEEDKRSIEEYKRSSEEDKRSIEEEPAEFENNNIVEEVLKIRDD